MNTQKSVTRADMELRQAHAAFEQSAIIAPDQPAPALPAFVGFLRAVGDLTRFALDVAMEPDHGDPMHLRPRILRAA